jgi:hypothetical protein
MKESEFALKTRFAMNLVQKLSESAVTNARKPAANHALRSARRNAADYFLVVMIAQKSVSKNVDHALNLSTRIARHVPRKRSQDKSNAVAMAPLQFLSITACDPVKKLLSVGTTVQEIAGNALVGSSTNRARKFAIRQKFADTFARTNAIKNVLLAKKNAPNVVLTPPVTTRASRCAFHAQNLVQSQDAESFAPATVITLLPSPNVAKRLEAVVINVSLSNMTAHSTGYTNHLSVQSAILRSTRGSFQ